MLKANSLPDHLGTVVRDGRRWSLFSDGTLLPVIAGGDGSGEGGTGGTPPNPTPPTPPAPTPPSPPTPPPPTSGVTFTPEQQAELQRIAAAEKAQGERSAQKTIADQLGVSIDDAKAIIDRQRAADLEKMTEAERKEAEASEKLAEAQRKEAAATVSLRDANVRSALITAGVKPERLSQSAKLVELGDDADEAAIKTAVEGFRTSTPEWFGTAQTPPPAPSGVPGGTGGGQQQPPANPNAIDSGREEARKLFGIPETKSA